MWLQLITAKTWLQVTTSSIHVLKFNFDNGFEGQFNLMCVCVCVCVCCVRVRELSARKVGSLLRIAGQMVRTHPVHPELTLGSFICLECQTSIPDVEQQFMLTQPTACKNPMCQNRRSFILDMTKFQFVDFQKVRIQETQQEMPRGSVPRR